MTTSKLLRRGVTGVIGLFIKQVCVHLLQTIRPAHGALELGDNSEKPLGPWAPGADRVTPYSQTQHFPCRERTRTKPSCTDDAETANWCSHKGKQHGGSPEN